MIFFHNMSYYSSVERWNENSSFLVNKEKLKAKCNEINTTKTSVISFRQVLSKLNAGNINDGKLDSLVVVMKKCICTLF